MKRIITDQYYVSHPTYSLMIGEDHYKGGFWIIHTKKSMHNICRKNINFKNSFLFIQLMDNII